MRFLTLLVAFIAFIPSAGAQTELRVVALGDSLTSGYGLQRGQDFASKLQAALRGQGLAVRVENAGVAGNTSEDGLRRLDNAVAGAAKPDLVIVALGGNDMLRRINPDSTKANLTQIMQKLKDRNIPVLLAGMKDPRLPGFFVKDRYAEIYDDLADQFDVDFYPFFLKDVALKKNLNLPDGIHPNAAGIDLIVQNILPSVEDALD